MSFHDYHYNRQGITLKKWYKEPLNLALIAICAIGIYMMVLFTYQEFYSGGSPITAPFHQATGKVK